MSNRFIGWIVVFAVVNFAGFGSAQNVTLGAAIVSEAGEATGMEHWLPPFGDEDILSINAFAFEAWSQTENNAVAVFGAERYCDGSICFLVAPVELPEGTIVSRIELDAVDEDGSSSVMAHFLRCPVGQSSCTGLGGTSTSGTPGNIQVGADLSIPEIIDNQANSYVVQVHLGDSSSTRFTSARLVFQPAASPAPVQFMSINSYAFDPYSIDGRAAIATDGVRRWCDGYSCSVVAPVELPSGTTVTRLELDGYDVGGGDVSVVFGRCSISSNTCEILGILGTTGTPGTTQVGIDLPAPEIINNYAYSYFLEALLGNSADTRLGSVRLTIEPPATPAQSDRLSMTAFAYEPWNSVGRTMLDATGPMRFCNGTVCGPIGPVELPSGAWVTRLEMTAYDIAGEDVVASFYRCPLGGSFCLWVETVTTTGMPGFTQVGVDLPEPELIDNENFSYTIQVVLGPDEDTGFYSTRLAVDLVTVFSDGVDSGETMRWSATVP